MQFKDAAFHILKQSGLPLHYNEITDRALTAGQTHHATMGALLYTDTLNENSRFKRADQKGFFTLKETLSPDIVHQIESLNSQARNKLRKLVSEMHPNEFENLIAELLLALLLEETSVQVTSFSEDGGWESIGNLRNQ